MRKTVTKSATAGYRDAYQILKWNLYAAAGILVFGLWLVIAAIVMGVVWGLSGSKAFGGAAGIVVFSAVPIAWGYVTTELLDIEGVG